MAAGKNEKGESLIEVDSIPSVSALLGNLKARCLGGPYNRVSAMSVYEKNSDIIYVGSASGGVFKTVNGGKSFKPVFDKYGSSSIGAVAVSQQNPDIVWVGTGEGWHRNDAGWGDGIYKSTDGGKTWKNMGLSNSFSFSKIVIDPRDNNIVLAGVLGSAWGPNEERGLYRIYRCRYYLKKVLYTNVLSGIGDIDTGP